MVAMMAKSYSILLGNKISKQLEVFMLRSHWIYCLRLFNMIPFSVAHTVLRIVKTVTMTPTLDRPRPSNCSLIVLLCPKPCYKTTTQRWV